MEVEELVTVGVIGLVALGGLTYAVDRFGGPSRPSPATVVAKVYTPATTSTGWNYGKGGGYVITSTPEKWEVVLRDEDGQVHGCDVGAEAWAILKEGNTIDATIHTGRISGGEYWVCP